MKNENINENLGNGKNTSKIKLNRIFFNKLAEKGKKNWNELPNHVHLDVLILV